MNKNGDANSLVVVGILTEIGYLFFRKEFKA
jgi:hypothetical protein